MSILGSSKYMKVKKEGMEVQKEAVKYWYSYWP